MIFSASGIGSSPEGGIEKGICFRVLCAFQPCIDGGLFTLGCNSDRILTGTDTLPSTGTDALSSDTFPPARAEMTSKWRVMAGYSSHLLLMYLSLVEVDTMTISHRLQDRWRDDYLSKYWIESGWRASTRVAEELLSQINTCIYWWTSCLIKQIFFVSMKNRQF